MMLGIGAIDIHEADFCLGLSGSIVFTNNQTGKTYRLSYTANDGYLIQERQPDRSYGSPTIIRLECKTVLDYLPAHQGWTEHAFSTAWAGFSAGFRRGMMEEQEQERKRKAFNSIPTAQGGAT